MEKNTNKKNVQYKVLKRLSFALPVLLVGVIALLTPSHFAHALTLSFFGDIAYIVIGKFAFFEGFIISYIGGILIAIEAWLIGVVLNMNAGVFQTAIVQTGFSISLSIANLGFVFGIIIIAIATILRLQSYGIKQILWKLVVMAILVNFGLVIMGVIFNFSNQFTNYFLQCIDPLGGGCNGTQTSYTSSIDFASRLAGAFNPQTDIMTTNSAANTTINVSSSSSNVFGNFGQDIGKMLIPLSASFFIDVSLIVIVISLAAFIIMLLIRYVYIAILAVLLPFAWMLWVFPKTKNNFDKWWGKFIQWTVFAPIVLFFLWLGLATASGLASNATGTQSYATYLSNNSNPLWAAISNLFTNIFSPLVQNALNEIVLLGLMVGGMIAAQSLSITGAKEAIGAIKESTKGLLTEKAKKAGRVGLKTAAWLARPGTRRAPGTGYRYSPNTALNRSRAKSAAFLQRTAESPRMQSKGLFSSVVGGAMRGSGLLKKKNKLEQIQEILGTQGGGQNKKP